MGVAQAAAGAGGYSINPITLASSSAPSGTIVRQAPDAGSRISPGEVVTVWVSPGPGQVNIPNVDGLNVQQAEQVLQAAGFNVQVTQFGPGNKVITYSPQGLAPQGSTITIAVGFSF